jgi:DNA polymerase I-like protein with 3'-5' exonuclease and polymerase domains
MLHLYDTNDIHALTASWFLGGTEGQYSKKLLGYECPERFLGKTLRHAGERGARGRRAMNEVNTSARKYKIDIRIDESMADAALKTFHKMCPNIQNVYFKEVTEIINRSRTLTAPLPYGIDAESGGKRSFFERHGDELIRQALSYLPQRAVSDNTKSAAVRIKKICPNVRLVMESHDALLYMVRETEVDEFVPIARTEMERPIDFSNCSLPRGPLSIPSDVEIGDNFMNLNKYRKVK